MTLNNPTTPYKKQEILALAILYDFFTNFKIYDNTLTLHIVLSLEHGQDTIVSIGGIHCKCYLPLYALSNQI